MPPPIDPGNETVEGLRGRILAFIGGGRRTPAEILKTLTDHTVPRAAIQAVLRGLVATGELTYTHEFGRTFIEPSFDRAVRVSRRIVLAPPGCSVSLGSEEVLIRIRPGAAFGGGRHPTTRLALAAVEAALSLPEIRPRAAGGVVLDIGTGTGVLAIAAVGLGLARGLGLDIDPCALAEARENVRLNGLEERIEITDRPVATLERRFLLIAANLRLPSLAELAPRIEALTEAGGCVAVSGLRPAECGEFLSVTAAGFEPVWRGEEFEWAGVALRKR
jgi:ribosomal protein L11 methyltransferase